MFAAWISGVLLPGMGVESVLESDRLEEVLDMLGTERKNWAQRVRDECRVEFREEGRVEGREEGRVEGREEGRVEGQVQGRRDLIVKLAGKRFGSSVTQRLAPRLQSVSDPERLDEVGVWLVSGVSVDDLLTGLGDR